MEWTPNKWNFSKLIFTTITSIREIEFILNSLKVSLKMSNRGRQSTLQFVIQWDSEMVVYVLNAGKHPGLLYHNTL
jgi:hypothetical protein